MAGTSHSEKILFKTVTFELHDMEQDESDMFRQEWKVIDEAELECPLGIPLGQVRAMAADHLADLKGSWETDGRPDAVLPFNPEYWLLGVQQRGRLWFYFPYFVDILDSSGGIVFGRHLREVDLADLRTASDAGLLGVDIDPHTVALGAFDTGANGGDGGLAFLEEWGAWNSLLLQITIGALGSLVGAGAHRLLRALGARWKEYRNRNANPEDVLNQILMHVYWPIEEATMRLRMTRAEVDEVLGALGYTLCEDDPRCYRYPDAGRLHALREYQRTLDQKSVQGFFDLPDADLIDHPVIQELAKAAEKSEEDR